MIVYLYQILQNYYNTFFKYFEKIIKNRIITLKQNFYNIIIIIIIFNSLYKNSQAIITIILKI